MTQTKKLPKKEDWNARLFAFDKTYFDYVNEEEETAFTKEEAAYALATWLFENLEINEEGWKLLKSIKKNLPELFDQALENIFCGHHDT